MAEYLLIAAGILFAAFFSGSETGSYCVNRLRVRLRAEQGNRAARSLRRLIRDPTLAISTMLVGTNIGLYAASVTCTHMLQRAGLAARAELYSGLIMPPILLIFAEIIPKSLFQHHADRLMYPASRPLRVGEVVFYPLAAALRWLSHLPRLLFGVRETSRRAAFTPETFRFYLGEGAAHGVLTSFQRTMAENIMRLKSTPLSEVMIPLPEVAMVERSAERGELLKLLRKHHFSRIPVYEEERANVVGMVNILDVAAAPGATIAEMMREPLTVPRWTSVADALWTLRQARQQLIVVVDPAGNAVGIATVKDLVEEIVGELEAW